MNTADIILLLAIVLTAGVPAWILFFRKQSGLNTSDLDTRLAEQQRQLVEELGKVREGMERVQRELNESLKLTFETRVDALKTSVSDTLTKGRESQDQRLDKVAEVLSKQGEENKNTILTLQERIAKELTELREQQSKASEKLGEDVRASLDKVNKSNEEKLETIRKTVDEKLHETLEKRLGESFKQVSERLEEVHKGLGEMQNLASGVGDLKRVLTNVRSRGTFGEVQLEALLEQVFTEKQYEKNCATIPGSSERVEFALVLPGRDNGDSPIYLPIDSKFPVEARERLEQAIEDGDKEAYTAAQKELGRLLLAEAQKIRSKYVEPPHTTDFAMMFIPTEGLYAEVLRVPELAEKMHAQHHVIPVGPMNLFAILNSLQMGFRTLAIEKRSTEVWKILSAVKTEFGKFGGVLEKVSTHLDHARKQIDQTGVRSRAIERRLRDVEELPEQDASDLLRDALPDSSTLQDSDLFALPDDNDED